MTEKKSMRLLAYNIAYASGVDGSFKSIITKSWKYIFTGKRAISKISSYVEDVNPDILALVEIDSGSVRTTFNSQIDHFLEGSFSDAFYETKYKNFLLKNMPIIKKNTNAVIVKDEKSNGNHQFHYLKKGTKRLVIEYDVTDGIKLLLVHLSLRKNTRLKQISELSTIVNTIQEKGKGVIMCGDFNVKSRAELHTLFSENGLKFVQKEPSFPSKNPKHTFDVVLTSDKVKVNSVINDDIQHSDHRPIIIDFDTNLIE